MEPWWWVVGGGWWLVAGGGPAGEVGRWQVGTFLALLAISLPGQAHIFLSAFIFARTDFWWAGTGWWMPC